MLSEKTRKNYKKHLENIQNLKIPIDGSMNIDSIVSNLQANNIGNGTIKCYLCALINNLRETNNPNIQFRESVSQKISELRKQSQTEINKNIMNDTEKEKYVKWDNILEVHNKLKKQINRDYVLISLYCLFPPRRVMDYAYMDVISSIEELLDDRNYYISDLKEFVFQKYKTAKVYKIQKFKISDQLDDILKIYIKNYNIVGSLLNMTESTLKRHLRNIFKANINKNIGVNVLRHSYISHKFNNGELCDKTSMLDLSEKMAHSIIEQLDYYKKDL